MHDVAILTQTDGQRCVENGNGRYPLTKGAMVNYKLKRDEKVFFAIYSSKGLTSADFVEPYFDSIDDLSRLK